MVKIKKNTDKNRDFNWDMRKIFLYVLGTSPKPLSPRQIENRIKNNFPGMVKGDRATYIYDLLEDFFPISLSDTIPSKILFTSDDLLKENEFNSTLSHVELNDDFKVKLKRKIYANYSSYFYYKDKNDKRHGISLNDLQVDGPIHHIQRNGKFSLSILIKNKKALLYDQINYIKILIIYKEEISKSDLTTDFLNVKLYSRSIIEDNEREIEISTNLKRSRLKSKVYERKRKLEFRKVQLSHISLKPRYLDVSPAGLPHNQYNFKKRPKLKYVINLRGLLYFLLLCNIKKDLEKIDRVLENLCDSDEYTLSSEVSEWRLREEYFKEMRNKVKNDQNEKRGKTTSKYQYIVESRFPFLYCYNKYKRCLPEKRIAKFLYNIAQEAKSELEVIHINALKYIITEKYLHLIRNWLCHPTYPMIQYLGIEQVQWDALRKFNNEVGDFIINIKEKELERIISEKNNIKESIEKIDFERNLNKLTSSNNSIIPVRSICNIDQKDAIRYSNFGLKILENYSKYENDVNKRYSFMYSGYLIKDTLLKEIYQNLRPTYTSVKLMKEMKKYGIPLECLHNIKNWFNEYEHSV